MHRIFAIGLLAILWSVSAIGLPECEGGGRRRERQTYCCPPANQVYVTTARCLQTVVECPQTLIGTATVGGVTYYIYSADQCVFNAGTSSTARETFPAGLSLTYTSELTDTPINCASYSCRGNIWTCKTGTTPCDTHGECVFKASASLVSFDETQELIERTVSNNHLGKSGLTDFADGMTLNLEPGFTVTTANFAFKKNDINRNALIFVIYDKEGRRPLHAVGFELKDSPDSSANVAETTQPHQSLASVVEAAVRAQNTSTSPATFDTLRLRIHTKK